MWEVVQSRHLQGLIGSIVNTVLGGDDTTATTNPSPTATSAPTTRAPTQAPTQAPTPTTRTPTPTTRTPTPTTRTPAPTTKTPTTKTPQPTTATTSSSSAPTPTSTPESTPEPSSSTSASIETETPETPVPTIDTISASFSASVDNDVTSNSSSSSVDGSFGHWSSGDSQNEGGLASSQDADAYTNSSVDTWMFVAITLAAVSMVLLCIGFVVFQRRKRREEDNASLQRHFIISDSKPLGADDTVNTRLDTSSTGPYTGGQHQENGGYSTSFLTAAQGGMWEDDIITAMRIPMEKLTRGKLLNKGGYGMVYRGSYRGEAVAIKTLLPEQRKTLAQINGFLSEIKIMAALEHPRVVRLLGVAWDSLADLCSVAEYMEGGDLRTLLNYFEYHECRPHGFDFEKARIALHIAHSLTYLHSLDPLVLHRDLKSKNILLTEDLEAKITDFGVSRESSDRTMTAGVGTSLWMAPEVMMGERYGSSADIFSFGVVLSELDSHVLPYAAAKETDSGRVIPDTALLQLVSLGLLRIEFSAHAPQALIDLAHSCVDLDAEARPSAGEVLYQLQLIMNMYEDATL